MIQSMKNEELDIFRQGVNLTMSVTTQPEQRASLQIQIFP